jgi:uncharacterized repeat protein (TIGR01451 family)
METLNLKGLLCPIQTAHKWWYSLLAGIALLFSTQAKAQIWGGGQAHYQFANFNSSNTWGIAGGVTPGSGIWGITVYNGTLYFAVSQAAVTYISDYLYSYKLPNGPLTSVYTTGGSANVFRTRDQIYATTDGKIYSLGASYEIQAWDIAAKTLTNKSTTLTITPGTPIPDFTSGLAGYDGSNLYYFVRNTVYNGPATLCKYNIATNTISTLSTTITPPAPAKAMVYLNGALYYGESKNFYKYDLKRNKESLVSSTTTANDIYGLTTNGTKLYASSYQGFKSYDFTTKTWTSHGTPFTPNLFPLAYDGSLSPPVVTVSATAATCTGQTINSNAQLKLNSYDYGSSKVGYSIGSTYTGPAYASATTLTAAPMTLVSNLANPASGVNQPYTIRIFKSATLYTDKTVMLSSTSCGSADLAITVTITPQTGNKGETLTYTFTAKNQGPNDVPDATAKINIPSNVTLLNASPSQGTYNASTQMWDIGALANGVSKTLTVSVKVN